MFFNSVLNIGAILLAIHFARFTQAAPVNDAELVVTKTITFPQGILTIWSDVSNVTSSSSKLSARACGTNDVVCDGGDNPSVGSCSQLIQIMSQNAGTVLSTAPRSLCLTQQGSQCCVSWADAVNGLSEGSLLPAAEAVQNACVVQQGISGLARNVNLQGVCTSQCLSNRPGGCTDRGHSDDYPMILDEMCTCTAIYTNLYK
jgi:hypothetical protein